MLGKETKLRISHPELTHNGSKNSASKSAECGLVTSFIEEYRNRRSSLNLLRTEPLRTSCGLEHDYATTRSVPDVRFSSLSIVPPAELAFIFSGRRRRHFVPAS